MKKYYSFIFSLILVVGFSCTSDEGGNNNEDVDVIQEFLDAHNSYRNDVGIGDLSWSTDLATTSKDWADVLAVDCGFTHSGGSYGENLWKGTSGFFSIQDVVDAWGSEKANYNYSDNTCDDGEVCGHYTQIVWANTTEVGCGTASCDGTDIWVCQYLPRGNFNGESPY